MNVYTLSAIELDVLARLCGKKRIQAIPDEFGELSAEEKSMAKAKTVDSLFEKALLRIDFDGKTYPGEDAQRIAEFISESENVVIIRQHGLVDGTEGLAIWQRKGQLLRAEQVGENFVLTDFPNADFTEMRDYLISRLPSVSVVNDALVEIPRLTMRRARRWCFEGKESEAMQLLRETGAPEDIVILLILGFLRKAKALFITCLYEEKQPLSLLFDDQKMITIFENQEIDRGCFAVSEISSVDAAHQVTQLAAAFERG